MPPPPRATLEIVPTEAGDTARVELRGELEHGTVVHLGFALSGLSETTRNVTLDLGGVTFVDSSGLGALVAALRYCRDRGGTLVLAGPRPGVRRLLSLTGLDRVMTVR